MNNTQIKEMLKKIIKNNKIIHSNMFIGTNLTKKYEYAKDIEFDDILDCIVKIMEQRKTLEV